MPRRGKPDLGDSKELVLQVGNEGKWRIKVSLDFNKLFPLTTKAANSKSKRITSGPIVLEVLETLEI